MANTDKNIVITPNVGSSSADPKIVFSGADASTTAQSITLQIYPTNSGTLSFEGSAGQLFSISNTMTGTIYSVNDVSGIPSIEVLDTGIVKIAQYAGNVLLGSATDTGEAKLQVTGGGYFTGNIGNSKNNKGVYLGLSSGNDPMIQLQGNGSTNPHIDFSNDTNDYDMRIVLTGDDTLNITGGALTVESNTVLHASNYTSYAATSGHNHTYNVNDAWLRDNGDDGQFKIYGNTRSIIFRTDGVTNDHGGGGYPFIWYYGSSNDAERRMILDTAGQLWTSNYGWLHSYFALSGHTHSYAGSGSAGGAANSLNNFTAAVGGAPLDPNSPTTLDDLGYATGMSLYAGGSAGTQTDGGLYVAGHSTSWYHEIYGDFRTGSISVRGKNSGTWQPWRSIPTIAVQDTAPTIYNNGDLWWESDTGKLKVCYYDGNTTQWVDAMPIPDTSTFYSKAGGAISGPVTVSSSITATGNLYIGDYNNSFQLGPWGTGWQTVKIKNLHAASEAAIGFYDRADSWMGTLYGTNGAMGFLNSSNSWMFQVASNGNTTLYGATQINGALTVGNTTDSNIYMTDTDETTRRIHCNSGRIGFLNSSNGWGAYCDNSGNWYANNLSGTNTGDQTSVSGSSGSVAHSGSRTDSTLYNVAWVSGNPSQLYSCDSVQIKSSIGGIQATSLGSSNTSSTTGNGLSLYNGATSGMAQYGISFAGTTTFGTHGSVSADWATYFTMDSTANRGWIFKVYSGATQTTGNVASINNSGTAVFAGNVTAYSDIRVKTNIQTIENALPKVLSLRGITYDRTDDVELGRQTGVIAQDVLKVLPEAVLGTEETTYSVAYGNMVGLLVEAIKDQQKIIEDQESRIARLEALVAKLVD